MASAVQNAMCVGCHCCPPEAGNGRQSSKFVSRMLQVFAFNSAEAKQSLVNADMRLCIESPGKLTFDKFVATRSELLAQPRIVHQRCDGLLNGGYRAGGYQQRLLTVGHNIPDAAHLGKNTRCANKQGFKQHGRRSLRMRWQDKGAGKTHPDFDSFMEYNANQYHRSTQPMPREVFVDVISQVIHSHQENSQIFSATSHQTSHSFK